MFECIIDEAIRSIRDGSREREGERREEGGSWAENKMKERKMMKQEEDRMEERKYSSKHIPHGGNL